MKRFSMSFVISICVLSLTLVAGGPSIRAAEFEESAAVVPDGVAGDLNRPPCGCPGRAVHLDGDIRTEKSSRLRSSNVRREICEHLLDKGFKVMLGGRPSHPMLYARKRKNIACATVG